jgi:hypothetical protein
MLLAATMVKSSMTLSRFKSVSLSCSVGPCLARAVGVPGRSRFLTNSNRGRFPKYITRHLYKVLTWQIMTNQ